MGFLRIRPRLMKKKPRSTSEKQKKNNRRPSIDIDDSGRTYDMELEDDSSRTESLDSCAQDRQDEHGVDLIKKRLSQREVDAHSRSSTTARRVSFLDEELGLTPRHVVTQVHYRPRTTENEKNMFYYDSHDFDVFEKEDFFEKIEDEIREIERQKKQHEASGQQKLVVKKVVDEKKIKEMMCRMSS